MVANIEGPRPLSQDEQTRLTRYIALARQLGAEVITTPGRDVAEALLRVARQNNVTQIIMGKPLGTPWFSFLRPDLLRWLMDFLVIGASQRPALVKLLRGSVATNVAQHLPESIHLMIYG